MKDYYSILQISPDASQDDVKKAYRRLAKVHHPDIAKNAGEDLFIQDIIEAYKTLGTPEKRTRYDWILTNKEAAPVAGNYFEPAYTQPKPRYRPFYKKAATEGELVKPYLKYTYSINIVALVFCLLLAIDFFLPLKERTDKAMYVVEVFSKYKNSQFHDHTQIQTWTGRKLNVSPEVGKYFSHNPHLLLYSTLMLGKPRYVALAGKLSQRYSISYSIYGNFFFLPLLLCVTALLGSIRRFRPELDFSFGVVSGILLLVSAGLLMV